MRLKKSESAQTVVRRGTITIDDIRRKFNIPRHAELTITTPYVNYDVRQWTHNLDEIDAKIEVRVEDIK